jgi:hypothetical protein
MNPDTDDLIVSGSGDTGSDLQNDEDLGLVPEELENEEDEPDELGHPRVDG